MWKGGGWVQLVLTKMLFCALVGQFVGYMSGN